MRRSERITTMLTALQLGVVGLCALVMTVVLAVHGARAPTPAESDPTLVPEDLLWPLLLSCGGGEITPILNLAADDEGRLEFDIGELDEQLGDGSLLLDGNGRPVIDEVQSRRMRDCTSRYRVELRRDFRAATDAERLVIYDWTIDWQAPCLEARGYEVTVLPFNFFIDRDNAAWFLLANRDWTQERYDFDDVLAARQACPPVPPYLAADGVGW